MFQKQYSQQYENSVLLIILHREKLNLFLWVDFKDLWIKLSNIWIETKFEYIIPVLNIFWGDSIRRPSHPEAQVVQHLISLASVTEWKYMNIIFLLSYPVFLYFECGKVIAQYKRGFSNFSKSSTPKILVSALVPLWTTNWVLELIWTCLCRTWGLRDLYFALSFHSCFFFDESIFRRVGTADLDPEQRWSIFCWVMMETSGLAFIGCELLL